MKLIPNKKPKSTIEERTASNSSTIEIMFDLNRLKTRLIQAQLVLLGLMSHQVMRQI